MADGSGDRLPGFKVTEAAIDPVWRLDTLSFEGASLIVLRVMHPRHGAIDMILPRETSARPLRVALGVVLDQ